MAGELDQFKETYITECSELLEEMEEKLLALHEGEVDLNEINAIFRCAHSIKGGGGAFGFTQLVKFTHEVEALLDAMREERLQPTEEIIEALLQSLDAITQLVYAARDDVKLPDNFAEDLKATVKALVEDQGGGAKPTEVSKPAPPHKHAKPGGEEIFYDISFLPHRRLFETGNEPLLIVRELKRLGEVNAHISTERIPPLAEMDVEECYLSWNLELASHRGYDAIREVFEFVEEECDLAITESAALCMPKAKDLADEDEFGGIFTGAMEGLQEVAECHPEPKAKDLPPQGILRFAQDDMNQKKSQPVSSIRVDIEKVDQLVNMVGELVITQAMLVNHTRNLPAEQFQHLHNGVEDLTRHTRELQEAVMAVRMQPVKTVFSRMPRIVRDLSRQLGKNIRIETAGEGTEIDKTVIEQLSEPLVHMIRNSVDHGIETPQERIAAGKPEQGVIRLSADGSGGRISIEIEDDGKGIDRERVLKRARERGLIQQDAVPTLEEIDNIVFLPGFSTAEKVTAVSGRGVGMDVVRRNIAELGGTIEIVNTPGKGLLFSVSLPLTLAILDGMIVGVGGEQYIVPISNILESLCPPPGAIKRVTDGNDVLAVRGEFLPILYLNRIFNTPDDGRQERMLVVLVESGRKKFGLVVDRIIGQQQVVIKSIEENSDPVPGVSGATILGDGNVSLILDIAQLRHIVADGAKVKAA